jgi:hypothetical protein
MVSVLEVGVDVGVRECPHSLPIPTRRQTEWLSSPGAAGFVGGQRGELANVEHSLMGGRGEGVARFSKLEGMADL